MTATADTPTAEPPELGVRRTEGQRPARRGGTGSHVAHAGDDDDAANPGGAPRSTDAAPAGSHTNTPPQEPLMPRFTRITRTVTAGLAIAALAAPTALARPLQDLRSPDAKDAAAHARTLQDLRMPDTRDAAVQSQQRTADKDIRTSSLAGTPEMPPKAGVYWAYDYEAGKPDTTTAAVQKASTGGGDDTDTWVTIGIAVAAAMLGGAGGAVVAGRNRGTRVPA